MRITFPPRSPSPFIEQFSYQALVYQFVVFLLFPVRNRIVLILDLISVRGALPRERRFIVLREYWTQSGKCPATTWPLLIHSVWGIPCVMI